MKLRIAAAAFLIFCIIASSACSAQPAGTEKPDSPKTGGDNIHNEVTETAQISYPPPKSEDFEGYVFRLGGNLSRNEQHFVNVTDEQNGEVVNDAVYLRNRKIEEDYNITIEGKIDSGNGINSKVKTSVIAGDDEYDIALMPNRTHFPLASEGYLIDVNTLSSLDLTKPWWDGSLLDSFRIYGKNYAIAGDITTTDDLLILIMVYNQKIYSDLGFENPYRMVSDGRWTFDRFFEMASQVAEDLDGDGVMGEEDRWGFLSEIAAWYYYSTGCGLDPLKRDGDGFVYTLDDERTYRIIEKTKVLVTRPDIVFFANDGKYTPKGGGNVFDGHEAMFMANKALFKSGNFNDVTRYRNMEVDFGILPTPKYDEAQEEYRCLVTYHMDSYVIPTTVAQPERTALITEALAYESMLTLTPRFYEIFLNEKLARDEDSKKMIDLIISTKFYDLDWTAQISTLGTMMNTMATNRVDTFASSWAAARDAAEASLAKFLEDFAD